MFSTTSISSCIPMPKSIYSTLESYIFCTYCSSSKAKIIFLCSRYYNAYHMHTNIRGSTMNLIYYMNHEFNNLRGLSINPIYYISHMFTNLRGSTINHFYYISHMLTSLKDSTMNLIYYITHVLTNLRGSTMNTIYYISYLQAIESTYLTLEKLLSQ